MKSYQSNIQSLYGPREYDFYIDAKYYYIGWMIVFQNTIENVPKEWIWILRLANIYWKYEVNDNIY